MSPLDSKLSFVEALDVLCACAEQFLMAADGGTLTHSFMSAEEQLCDFLVKHGRMEQLGPAHFRLVSLEEQGRKPLTPPGKG